MDVMGIAFRRELYLSTRQVFPPLQDRDKAVHTKIQAKLLRKLGEHAYPFFFEVSSRRSAGGRSRLRKQTCVCVSSVSGQPALLSGSAAGASRRGQGKNQRTKLGEGKRGR